MANLTIDHHLNSPTPSPSPSPTKHRRSSRRQRASPPPILPKQEDFGLSELEATKADKTETKAGVIPDSATPSSEKNAPVRLADGEFAESTGIAEWNVLRERAMAQCLEVNSMLVERDQKTQEDKAKRNAVLSAMPTANVPETAPRDSQSASGRQMTPSQRCCPAHHNTAAQLEPSNQGGVPSVLVHRVNTAHAAAELAAMGNTCHEMHEVACALLGRVDSMSLSATHQRPQHTNKATGAPSKTNLMSAVNMVCRLLSDVSHAEVTNEEAASLAKLHSQLGACLDARRVPTTTATTAGSSAPKCPQRARPIKSSSSPPTQQAVETVPVPEEKQCGAARTTPSRHELIRNVRKQRAGTKVIREDPQSARCWVCDEMDRIDELLVECGCKDRRAHAKCLDEWISMLDGSSAASVCVACNREFRVNSQA